MSYYTQACTYLTSTSQLVYLYLTASGFYLKARLGVTHFRVQFLFIEYMFYLFPCTFDFYFFLLRGDFISVPSNFLAVLLTTAQVSLLLPH
jgi:hypothetical protein